MVVAVLGPVFAARPVSSCQHKKVHSSRHPNRCEPRWLDALWGVEWNGSSGYVTSVLFQHIWSVKSFMLI